MLSSNEVLSLVSGLQEFAGGLANLTPENQ